MSTTVVNRGVWSADEHDRFLQAIQVYPHGPWRYVSKHVGTRDVRQVQTHAQKYYEKVGRHMRGLRKERRSWVRSEHRIDDLPPGLQRPLGPSNIQARLQSSPSLGDATSMHMCIPVAQAPSHTQHQDQDWLLSEMAHSAPELGMLAQLPSLEESLDMLLECLSD